MNLLQVMYLIYLHIRITGHSFYQQQQLVMTLLIERSNKKSTFV